MGYLCLRGLTLPVDEAITYTNLLLELFVFRSSPFSWEGPAYDANWYHVHVWLSEQRFVTCFTIHV